MTFLSPRPGRVIYDQMPCWEPRLYGQNKIAQRQKINGHNCCLAVRGSFYNWSPTTLLTHKDTLYHVWHTQRFTLIQSLIGKPSFKKLTIADKGMLGSELVWQTDIQKYLKKRQFIKLSLTVQHKGSLSIPKWMNFRKFFKWPLPPPPPPPAPFSGKLFAIFSANWLHQHWICNEIFQIGNDPPPFSKLSPEIHDQNCLF